MKKIMAVILTGAVLMLTACRNAVNVSFDMGSAKQPDHLSLVVSDDFSEGQWQTDVSFPDRRGKVDNTLAMNSIVGFEHYSGQGEMFVSVSNDVTSFDMYVNDIKVDTSEISGGSVYKLDFSKAAKNGRNTVSVCAVKPLDLADAVRVCIPYPVIREGLPEDVGIRPETLDLISDIISSDIENGFTSAQLAVIRDGVLVYQNCWGKTNSYTPDGTRKTDSADVTNDTLYDLASVTKMFSVNYCLQKLVTEGKISLDSKVTEFLGEGFADKTLDFEYDTEKVAGAEPSPGIDVQKEWKDSLTIRDILRHQGGFPPGPRYANPYVDATTQEYGEGNENILFAGNDATEETRQATIEAVCKTPLLYEPGTKTLYSDVDYLILGLIVEQVTGQDLDSYMKDIFFEPMGLTHITFKPIENGFDAEDCAATEPAGNTRDGYLDYPGIRTDTIQGEVHDEMAYYSMGGVSGHAGLFSNATDLAKLASVMLTGGYGQHRFFSQNTIDIFTAPKKEDAANWGLGWWREGDDQRPWYFGSQSSSRVFGHQGWTGTMVMIDPDNGLVVAYLTNKINSPVTDKEADPNKFNGNYYTASTLGFVPQLLTIGMDSSAPVDDQLFSLFAEMTKDSMKLVDTSVMDKDHPACKNVDSKIAVLMKMAEKSQKEENIQLAQQIAGKWQIKMEKN